MQSQIPGGASYPTGLPLKKKRGRKPKNFLLLKEREKEDAAIMQARMNNENGIFRNFSQFPHLQGTIGQNGGGTLVNGVWVPEIENEEEVEQRQNEYTVHPLYRKLQEYDEELKDFITERQEKKAKHSKKFVVSESNLIPSQVNNNGLTGMGQNNVQQAPINLFSTTKVISNAP